MACGKEKLLLRKHHPISDLDDTPTHLFASFLVLTEEMIKDGSILFMNPLHFVNVLGDLFHSNQGIMLINHDDSCQLAISASPSSWKKNYQLLLFIRCLNSQGLELL